MPFFLLHSQDNDPIIFSIVICSSVLLSFYFYMRAQDFKRSPLFIFRYIFKDPLYRVICPLVSSYFFPGPLDVFFYFFHFSAWLLMICLILYG